jgi:hypothetical protein
MRMSICAVSLALGLPPLVGCAPLDGPVNQVCETSLAAVAARPAQHIGKRFCGEVILSAGQNLALATPLEKPEMTADELAVVVLQRTAYAKSGVVQGKRYRVRLEGLIEGDARCFVRSNDVCVPYERQLFLSPDQLQVIGPA